MTMTLKRLHISLYLVAPCVENFETDQSQDWVNKTIILIEMCAYNRDRVTWIWPSQPNVRTDSAYENCLMIILSTKVSKFGRSFYNSISNQWNSQIKLHLIKHIWFCCLCAPYRNTYGLRHITTLYMTSKRLRLWLSLVSFLCGHLARGAFIFALHHLIVFIHMVDFVFAEIHDH